MGLFYFKILNWLYRLVEDQASAVLSGRLTNGG
jgi:hypothetical protein